MTSKPEEEKEYKIFSKEKIEAFNNSPGGETWMQYEAQCGDEDGLIYIACIGPKTEKKCGNTGGNVFVVVNQYTKGTAKFVTRLEVPNSENSLIIGIRYIDETKVIEIAVSDQRDRDRKTISTVRYQKEKDAGSGEIRYVRYDPFVMKGKTFTSVRKYFEKVYGWKKTQRKE